MAVFAKNSITQVSGFDNPCIAGELVYQQQTYWNLSIKDADDLPVDLTDATINAQIIRRTVTNIQDTRYGLSFDIGNHTPTPDPIDLTVTPIDLSLGQFTLILDSDAWGLMSDDPELDINAQDCVGYSGRIKIGIPADTSPANDYIVFLLFLVRSDGIVVE